MAHTLDERESVGELRGVLRNSSYEASDELGVGAAPELEEGLE